MPTKKKKRKPGVKEAGTLAVTSKLQKKLLLALEQHLYEKEQAEKAKPKSEVKERRKKKMAKRRAAAKAKPTKATEASIRRQERAAERKKENEARRKMTPKEREAAIKKSYAEKRKAKPKKKAPPKPKARPPALNLSWSKSQKSAAKAISRADARKELVRALGKSREAFQKYGPDSQEYEAARRKRRKAMADFQDHPEIRELRRKKKATDKKSVPKPKAKKAAAKPKPRSAAQKRYFDIVNKHGKNSPQAEKAAKALDRQVRGKKAAAKPKGAFERKQALKKQRASEERRLFNKYGSRKHPEFIKAERKISAKIDRLNKAYTALDHDKADKMVQRQAKQEKQGGRLLRDLSKAHDRRSRATVEVKKKAAAKPKAKKTSKEPESKRTLKEVKTRLRKLQGKTKISQKGSPEAAAKKEARRHARSYDSGPKDELARKKKGRVAKKAASRKERAAAQAKTQLKQGKPLTQARKAAIKKPIMDKVKAKSKKRLKAARAPFEAGAKKKAVPKSVEELKKISDSLWDIDSKTRGKYGPYSPEYTKHLKKRTAAYRKLEEAKKARKATKEVKPYKTPSSKPKTRPATAAEARRAVEGVAKKRKPKFRDAGKLTRAEEVAKLHDQVREQLRKPSAKAKKGRARMLKAALKKKGIKTITRSAIRSLVGGPLMAAAGMAEIIGSLLEARHEMSGKKTELQKVRARNLKRGRKKKAFPTEAAARKSDRTLRKKKVGSWSKALEQDRDWEG